MIRLFNQFCDDVSGATAIEYALIAAFIGISIITTAGLVGEEVQKPFENVKKGFEKS